MINAEQYQFLIMEQYHGLTDLSNFRLYVVFIIHGKHWDAGLVVIKDTEVCVYQCTYSILGFFIVNQLWIPQPETFAHLLQIGYRPHNFVYTFIHPAIFSPIHCVPLLQYASTQMCDPHSFLIQQNFLLELIFYLSTTNVSLKSK